METFEGYRVNYEKRTKRHNLLKEHPELKLRVDTTRLKKIISYVAFRCFDECSIARDEAIRGSDIDGGLVILEEQCSIDRQIKFIQELKNQGFCAYHELEYRRLVEERRAHPPTFEDILAQGDAISELTKAEFSRVLFHTIDEIEEIINLDISTPNRFYPMFEIDYNPPLSQIGTSYTKGFDIDTEIRNNLYFLNRSRA